MWFLNLKEKSVHSITNLLHYTRRGYNGHFTNKIRVNNWNDFTLQNSICPAITPLPVFSFFTYSQNFIAVFLLLQSSSPPSIVVVFPSLLHRSCRFCSSFRSRSRSAAVLTNRSVFVVVLLPGQPPALFDLVSSQNFGFDSQLTFCWIRLLFSKHCWESG